MKTKLLVKDSGSHGWYISTMIDRKIHYMHKDGTLHAWCGKENFYATEEVAIIAVAANQGTDFHLPEGLFEL